MEKVLKILPIDVNMPDLKGMLLLWKPTGPAKNDNIMRLKQFTDCKINF